MIAIALATVLGSTALADAPQADPATGRIVNGTVVRGQDFPAAVAIGFDVPNYGRQASCSASLITPRILLTAAHCTDEYAKYGIDKSMIIRVGAAFLTNDVQAPKTVTARFEDLVNHPDYFGGQTSIRNDIGVIVLAEPVQGVQPVWFRETPLTREEVIGATVTSVGFGVTSGNGRDSGIKRMADLTVDDMDAQFLYSRSSTNDDGANVCSGDSGGPQYAVVGHRLEQWAVHSFVASGNRTDICRDGISGSTNVGEFSRWILRHVERVHGTTDRCAINGLYADRICDDTCADPDADCVLDEDGDGLVSDDEFELGDRDGDGSLDDDEVEAILDGSYAKKAKKGCDQSGGGPLAGALIGLLALGLRRRR